MQAFFLSGLQVEAIVLRHMPGCVCSKVLPHNHLDGAALLDRSTWPIESPVNSSRAGRQLSNQAVWECSYTASCCIVLTLVHHSGANGCHADWLPDHYSTHWLPANAASYNL